jgi:hypothetical protein
VNWLSPVESITVLGYRVEDAIRNSYVPLSGVIKTRVNDGIYIWRVCIYGMRRPDDKIKDKYFEELSVVFRAFHRFAAFDGLTYCTSPSPLRDKRRHPTAEQTPASCESPMP